MLLLQSHLRLYVEVWKILPRIYIFIWESSGENTLMHMNWKIFWNLLPPFLLRKPHRFHIQERTRSCMKARNWKVCRAMLRIFATVPVNSFWVVSHCGILILPNAFANCPSANGYKAESPVSESSISGWCQGNMFEISTSMANNQNTLLSGIRIFQCMPFYASK